MSLNNDFQRMPLPKIYNQDGTSFFLDPFRKKLISITSEEKVRQRMAKYLVEILEVPFDMIFIEDSVTHSSSPYHKINSKDRIDIAIRTTNKDNSEPFTLAVVECKAEFNPITNQTFEQAKRYGELTGAIYLLLTNGIDFHAYAYDYYSEKYLPIIFPESFQDMTRSEHIKIDSLFNIPRIDKIHMFDIEYLRNDKFTNCFIGEDTPEEIIPAVVNMGECFLDETHKFPAKTFGDIRIHEDLGYSFLAYDNAAGGGFGTGEYRALLVEDEQGNTQIVNIGVMPTGKSVNDPMFGNSMGKSVLVVSFQNLKKDRIVIQLNLNEFMRLCDIKNIRITHNGKVGMKNARSVELRELVAEKYPNMVSGDRIILGKLDYSDYLFMDTPCMVNFVINLIQYSLLRDKYKDLVSNKNKKLIK